MLADKNRTSARGSFPLEDWLLPALYQNAPLDFAFATKAKIEKRESHVPKGVAEYREAHGFVGRDSAILEMERAGLNLPVLLQSPWCFDCGHPCRLSGPKRQLARCKAITKSGRVARRSDASDVGNRPIGKTVDRFADGFVNRQQRRTEARKSC